MSSIKIENLEVKIRSSTGENLIIQDISMNIIDGEFVVILGPSGCGKTTFLNSIASLVKYNGSIKIGDNITNGLCDIAYVFETPRLLNWLTIEQNVALPLLGKKNKDKLIRNITKRYINLCGIEEIKLKYPLDCSEGEQARTNIARALTTEPKVILMDEPFSHLDEKLSWEIRDQLLAIWLKDKKSIIFVTHSAIEAVYLADQVYILSKKPSTIIKNIKINLNRPRIISDPEFIQTYSEIIDALKSF
jgi:NitT/TauT family transport system ATP-binding protein